jgi:hypothetical protein
MIEIIAQSIGGSGTSAIRYRRKYGKHDGCSRLANYSVHKTNWRGALPMLWDRAYKTVPRSGQSGLQKTNKAGPF